MPRGENGACAAWFVQDDALNEAISRILSLPLPDPDDAAEAAGPTGLDT